MSEDLHADKVRRLETLRYELTQTGYQEWQPIEKWIAGAAPVIHHDWPQHGQRFDDLAKKPREPRLVFRGGGGNSPSTSQEQIKRHGQVQANLLAFLDGLLRLGPGTSQAPQTPSDRSQRRETESMTNAEHAHRESEIVDPNKARTVFVVHGRNIAAVTAIKELVRSLDVKPLEWAVARQRTGKASPYVGEIVDKAFESGQAIIVVCTPDDEARARAKFLKPDDGPHERMLTGQARQNVILEMGMALGKFPDRTIIVTAGSLRPMTDTIGRYEARMADTPAFRKDIAERLKTAGCQLDMNGEEWLTAGSFGTVLADLAKLEAAPSEETSSQAAPNAGQIARGLGAKERNLFSFLAATEESGRSSTLQAICGTTGLEHLEATVFIQRMKDIQAIYESMAIGQKSTFHLMRFGNEIALEVRRLPAELDAPQSRSSNEIADALDDGDRELIQTLGKITIDSKGISATDFAREFGLTPAVMTGALQDLVHKGLVHKGTTTSPDLYSLTDLGIDVVGYLDLLSGE